MAFTKHVSGPNLMILTPFFALAARLFKFASVKPKQRREDRLFLTCCLSLSSPSLVYCMAKENSSSKKLYRQQWKSSKETLGISSQHTQSLQAGRTELREEKQSVRHSPIAWASMHLHCTWPGVTGTSRPHSWRNYSDWSKRYKRFSSSQEKSKSFAVVSRTSAKSLELHTN